MEELLQRLEKTDSRGLKKVPDGTEALVGVGGIILLHLTSQDVDDDYDRYDNLSIQDMTRRRREEFERCKLPEGDKVKFSIDGMVYFGRRIDIEQLIRDRDYGSIGIQIFKNLTCGVQSLFTIDITKRCKQESMLLLLFCLVPSLFPSSVQSRSRASMSSSIAKEKKSDRFEYQKHAAHSSPTGNA